MKTIRATEARNNFQELIDNIHYTQEKVVVFKHKKPWVVIVSLAKAGIKLEELQKFQESLKKE